MDILLYGAAFILFVFGATLFTYIYTMMGIRLKKGSCTIRQREEIPGYLAQVFARYEEILVRMGFEYSHCQLVDTPFVNDYSTKWSVVFCRPDKETFASVYPSDFPEPDELCKIEFTTFFSSGKRLNTVNGSAHRIFGEFPGAILRDPYAGSIEEQWEAHEKTLRELTGEGLPAARSADEYVHIFNEAMEEYVTSLEGKGWIYRAPGEDNSWSLRLIPVISMTFKMLEGEGKAARQKKSRLKAGAGSTEDVPPELAVESYRRLAYNSATRKNMGWMAKVLLLAVSIFFFALSFKISMSFESLVILIAVVMLHELGHLLGMMLFGYKDLKILFLPFLGAATIGSRRETKPYQRIIVSFLGPVPGIVAGLLILFIFPGGNGIIRETALMLLILNYINLLPIMPLDGGQIFNQFIAKFPYFQLVFQIISALLFLLIFGFMSPVLLIIGVVLMTAAFSTMSICALHNRLRKNMERHGSEASDEQILRELFGLMNEKQYAQLPFLKKFQIAKSLVDNYIAEPPSVWVIIATFAFYVSLFVVPAVLYIISLVLRHLGS